MKQFEKKVTTIRLFLILTFIIVPSVSFANNCTNLSNQAEIIGCVKTLQNEIQDLKKSQNTIIKQGMVLMWSKGESNLPEGWGLCDGKNGPKLMDKFIIGAGNRFPTTSESGTETHSHAGTTHIHKLKESEIPSHTHETTVGIGTVLSGGGHSGKLVPRLEPSHHAKPGFKTMLDGGGNKSHKHGIGDENHLPPYYALAFICKVN